MSKRAIAFLLAFLFGAGTSIIKGPVFGLLTYMFAIYTQTTWAKNVFGFTRWSLSISIITLCSYMIHKNRVKELIHLKIPQLKWLILILINFILISFIAVDSKAHQARLIEISKLIILYFLVISIIQNKAYYKAFIMIHILGNWFLGYEGWSRGKFSHGRLENIGIPGARGSNDIASFIILIFPFLSNMVLFGQKWEKIIAICASPFVLNLFILCNSRGAFLGVVAMVLSIAILSQKTQKKERYKIIIGLMLAGLLFSQLVHKDFKTRLNTIKTYQDDSSATGRIDSWIGALKLIGDHPLGAGGHGFVKLSFKYAPEIVEDHGGQLRSVHNTYLQIATNFGIQGFIFFCFFYYGTFKELHNIRKRIGSSDDKFYYNESIAIEAALIGWMVAAIFGSSAFDEGFYWYCALGSALSNIQQSEIKDRLKDKKKPRDLNYNERKKEINHKEILF